MPEDHAATPVGPGSPDSARPDLIGGRLIDVSGDGPSRGAVHGEELRDLIAGSLGRWRQAIGERTGRRPDAYVQEFLGSTGFVATVSALSPDLYDEVLALAAASGQPVDDVLVFNMMDEQWRFEQSERSEREAETGCSVIGTAAPHGAGCLLGQNMDLPLSMDGSQAVLRIAGHDGRPGQLVMTAAGMIGLFGVNAAGLACCVNTLAMLPSARTGMPVAFVVREVLRHRDAASAAKYLASVPHASGQHYALADRRGMRGYECSARGCAAGPPDEKALLHTNHPLWWADGPAAGDDAGDCAHLPAGDAAEGCRHSPTTYARLRALTAGLDDVRRSGDVEALLSSTANGLCVRPTPQRASATFCSAEFTLTTPPAVRVALGSPDRTPWQPVGWTGDMPTGR